MRLGDLDALRKNMEFICMGIMAGTEPYNAPLTEIDNAPTFDVTKNQAYDQGFITAMRLYSRPQGEWVVVYEENNIKTCKCSKCGRIEDIVDFDKYPFCHCGADMRGNNK